MILAVASGPKSDPAARRATDADRNCVSHIWPEGIGNVEAAFKLSQMLRAMGAWPAAQGMTWIGC